MNILYKSSKTPLSEISAQNFRIPLTVTHVYVSCKGSIFPICPRCLCSLEFEYQTYCDRCGQCLSWNKYDSAVRIDKII